MDKRKNDLKIPFASIEGDILHLKNFGGARVIYAWIKGTGDYVRNYAYNLFLNDEEAEIFITDFKLDEHPNVKLAKKYNARSDNTSFVLNFYQKLNFKDAWVGKIKKYITFH